MAIGDIAQGLTKSFSNYITSERERTRKMEDEEIEYQQKLLTMMAERPDISPAMYGKALHDLVALQSGKKNRKQKGGAEGFMGHSELPISELLTGLQSGLIPLQGPTTEAYDMPELPTKAAGVPNPQMILNGQPIGPVEASQQPVDASKLAKASQSMAEWRKSRGRRPVAQQPLLRSPEEMAQEGGRAKGMGTMAELDAMFEGSGTTISPKDRDTVMRKRIGVPIYKPSAPVQVTLPDGRVVAGSHDANIGMYVADDGTPLPGAVPVRGAPNRLSSLYQEAAVAVGLDPNNAASWGQDGVARVRDYLMGVEGERIAQRLGMTNEYLIERAKGMPLNPSELVQVGGMVGDTISSMSGRQALPNDTRQRVGGSLQLMRTLNEVEQLSREMLSEGSGLWERVGNTFRLNVAALNGDPRYARLQTLIRTTLPRVARSIGSDVGNIAVAEAENYLAGFPALAGLNLADTQQGALAKISELKQGLAGAVEGMTLLPMNPNEPYDAYVMRAAGQISPYGAGFSVSPDVPQPPQSAAPPPVRQGPNGPVYFTGRFNPQTGNPIYSPTPPQPAR